MQQNDGWDVQTSIREDSDGGLVVQRRQLVGDHVDYCKARANEGLHGFPDFKLKASIPAVVVEPVVSRPPDARPDWMQATDAITFARNEPPPAAPPPPLGWSDANSAVQGAGESASPSAAASARRPTTSCHIARPPGPYRARG